LQTNKVKALLPFVASIHSVDSEKIAREIAKRWSALGRADKLPVFIEVNIDAETNKAGVAPSEAPALAELIGHELGKELELQGLMCVPAVGGIPNTRGSGFARLRELEAKCRPWSKGQLSMGMSSDFEAAIAEGATQVRVGTALFGKR
jgi:pyridoxal phosphate enzyme (YggS family)